MYTIYFIISSTLSLLQHFSCISVIVSMSKVFPAVCYIYSSNSYWNNACKGREIKPDSLSFSSDGSFNLVLIRPCLITDGTIVSVNVEISDAISFLACSSLSTPFPWENLRKSLKSCICKRKMHAMPCLSHNNVTSCTWLGHAMVNWHCMTTSL